MRPPRSRGKGDGGAFFPPFQADLARSSDAEAWAGGSVPFGRRPRHPAPRRGALFGGDARFRARRDRESGEKSQIQRQPLHEPGGVVCGDRGGTMRR